MKIPVVFDTEIYANYLLLMFRNVETGKTAAYELVPGGKFNREAVRSIMYKYTIVSFNGWRFDMPLIMMALHGCSVEEIKAACNAIIDEKLNCWDDAFRERFPDAAFSRKDYDHIDLIEVAPGTASLKIYGGRLHSRRMQDLPIEPKALITDEQRPVLREYCGNDLETTIDLFKKLKPQLELRESMSARYGVDLRSKSDAQIAEAVIRGRVQRDTKQWIDPPKIVPATMFQYVKPDFIRFQTPEMQAALAVVTSSHFYVSGTGNVEMSDELKATKITFDGSVYRMGIGGLHSSEQRQAIVARDSDFVLVDRDVRSYYPQIILNLGLFPAQMGPTFLDVYKDLIRRRLHAKDKAIKIREAIKLLEKELHDVVAEETASSLW